MLMSSFSESFSSETKSLPLNFIVIHSSVNNLEIVNLYVKVFAIVTTRWNSRTTNPHWERRVCFQVLFYKLYLKNICNKYIKYLKRLYDFLKVIFKE